MALAYDRAGRLRSATDAAGTRSIGWTDRDQLGNESYTNGLLSGMTVTRAYDTQYRLSTLGLSVGATATTRQRLAYDSISRLDYIADETPDGATVLHKFDYAFKTNTPFVQTVNYLRGTTYVMTQSYSRDSLGRLAGAGATLAAGGTVSAVNYQFDNLDRRFEADLADGSKWNYGYNDRSEVTTGKKKFGSGLFAAGQQFEYGYDDIGNRTSTKAGGDSIGNNLRAASYSANALNQLTSRGVPGAVDLIGTATNTATVTVNNQATYRHGDYFWKELTADNASAPVYLSVTNLAVLNDGTNADFVKTNTGFVYLPKTPEAFVYDADGNLLSDGRWTNTWDCENRLIAMEAISTVPSAAKSRLEFAYDYSGRRVQKILRTWNGTQYVGQSTNRFVYDGWNLIAVMDAQSSILQSFRWGLDLGGTIHGAGGVGGLLSMTVHTGPQAGTYFYSYDGNGNVMGFVNAADQTIAAQYEYGPFGEGFRSTGPMAKANSFRFSTKYQDDETDFLYYGFRYYNPSTGRWLSRDPIEEQGGLHLYGFVDNSSVNLIDTNGRELWETLRNAQRNDKPPASGILSGPWSMYGHLHYGDLGADVRISNDLLQQASQQLKPLKFRLADKLQKYLKCCESGNAHVSNSEDKFGFEENSFIPGVSMGRWQVWISANCDWQCGSSGKANGCVCTADCKLKVFLYKTYTFDPSGYNTANASLGIQMLNYYAIKDQYYLRANLGQPAYFITGEFADTYSAKIWHKD